MHRGAIVFAVVEAGLGKNVDSGVFGITDLFLARGFGKRREGRKATLFYFGAGAWWPGQNFWC